VKTPEEIAAYYKELLGTLKNKGFASVEELIAAYDTSCVDLSKAEAARDKAVKHNEEAGKMIRTKGGENGVLKEKISELEMKISELEEENKALKEAGPAPAPAGTQPAPVQPQVPAEERLKQVESGLTEEQRQVAEALFNEMSDDDASRMVNDKEYRLGILEGIVKDPDLNTFKRPKSLFTEPTAPAAPQAPESPYESLKLRFPTVLKGPSGVPGVRPTGAPTAPAGAKKANWVHAS
jgi:cell division protein FtsN